MLFCYFATAADGSSFCGGERGLELPTQKGRNLQAGEKEMRRMPRMLVPDTAGSALQLPRNPTYPENGGDSYFIPFPGRRKKEQQTGA